MSTAREVSGELGQAWSFSFNESVVLPGDPF